MDINVVGGGLAGLTAAIASDSDECGFLARYTVVDPTLAPAGEDLVQAQLPVREGESRAQVTARLEALLDSALDGWRTS